MAIVESAPGRITNKLVSKFPRRRSENLDQPIQPETALTIFDSAFRLLGTQPLDEKRERYRSVLIPLSGGRSVDIHEGLAPIIYFAKKGNDRSLRLQVGSTVSVNGSSENVTENVGQMVARQLLAAEKATRQRKRRAQYGRTARARLRRLSSRDEHALAA